MQCKFLTADNFFQGDDWRPIYHFSGAEVLRQLGENWPVLSDSDVQIHDGWRFSDNAESDWYLRNVRLKNPLNKDSMTNEYSPLNVSGEQRLQAQQFKQAIDGALFYRMRHIGFMTIEVDPVLMALPAFDDKAFCIQPGDVLIRRVGKVSAAIATFYHRRHPIDANIAIIRGLPKHTAVWLAYCLNQSLYQSYLGQQGGISGLLRVGIKPLASIPFAECPVTFIALAQRFYACYEKLAQAEDALFNLHKDVRLWLSDTLPDEYLAEQTGQSGLAARFFKPSYLGNQLTYTSTEHTRVAQALIHAFSCLPLPQLATINPKPSASQVGDAALSEQTLKISDLDGLQSFGIDRESSSGEGWRVHKRQLAPFDVLVSTFIQDSKVAMVPEQVAATTSISEQLVVLNFHRSPGAYALLMETPFVRRQLSGLVFGNLQKFVSSAAFEQLVLPDIDQETAGQWHNRLLVVLNNKTEAKREMAILYKQMHRVYRQIHPSAETASREGITC